MIEDERAQNVHDVAREIDQNRQQRAELNHGDRRGGLLGLQRFVRAAKEIDEAGRENEMSSGTNRDKFRQALNEAEEDSLKNGHYGSFSKRIPLRDPIIHRRRHQQAGAYDGRELPGKSVDLLLFLDS